MTARRRSSISILKGAWLRGGTTGPRRRRSSRRPRFPGSPRISGGYAIWGIAVLIVDTPPALTATIADVVRLADLVVIPTRPSPHDLRSIGATAELVEHLGKPLVFVLNGATPRARINGEALSVLSQHGMLAPVVVHQRIDFATSMIDGRTVMELPHPSRSCEEIEKLWTYVSARLEGTPPRRALAAMPRRRVQETPYAMAGAARQNPT